MGNQTANTPAPTTIDTKPKPMLTVGVGLFLAPGVAWDRATTPAAIAAAPKPIPMMSQLVTTASAPSVKAAFSHLV